MVQAEKTCRVKDNLDTTSSSNGRPTMRSHQESSVFHKTSMCKFNMRGACAKGAACKFAHSKSELHAMPDLSQTRLCLAYKAGHCNDSSCKFAHGRQELRPLHREAQAAQAALAALAAAGAARQAQALFPPQAPRNQNGGKRTLEFQADDPYLYQANDVIKVEKRNLSCESDLSTQVPDPRNLSWVSGADEIGSLAAVRAHREENTTEEDDDDQGVVVVENTFITVKVGPRSMRRSSSAPSLR